MKRKIIFITSSLIVLSCLFAFLCIKKDNFSYNFNSPTSTLILPDILHEISGLTVFSHSEIACVQDEKGIVFIYDFLKKEIVNQYNFAPDGDYEGITKVNNSFYVLRSDGTIFEVEDYLAEELIVNQYPTKVAAKNNEGLCYDKKNNRLLIASKSKLKKDEKNKTKRGIYGFDLKTKKSTEKPVYLFDVNDFNKQLAKTAKKVKIKEDLKFKMSGIAIHPITNEMYILSASDYMLFIFNKKGVLKNAIELNPTIYNKAEGITFLNNGDMLISNEGKKNKPTLLLFHYKKQ